jgi:hypothetical protein
MSSRDRAFGRETEREEIQEILEGRDNSWATPWRYKREQKLTWLDDYFADIDLPAIRQAHSEGMLKIHNPASPPELRTALELTLAGLTAIDRLYDKPREPKVIAPRAKKTLLEGYSILLDIGIATRPSNNSPQ